MSLIGGLTTTSQLAVVFLLFAIVVRQVNSQDPDMDVFVPRSGGMKTIITCQGKDRNLSCTNTSMVLVINKAWYGRKEKGKIICPYNPINEKEDTNDQELSCEEDVRPKVRKICHKRKTCQLSAKKEVFGRPCPGIYKYLEVIYACANEEEIEPTSLSSTFRHSSSVALHTTPSTVSDETSRPDGDNVSLPFTKAIMADSLPVYVPKNVTKNVTKSNVTKSYVTKSNKTQSDTTIPPTTSMTPTSTKPLNSSCTTNNPTSQPMTSPVPYLPSRTVIKTVDNVKQPSTSTAYSHYSTSIMGQQSNAFKLSTAGRLLIWFLHFRDNSSSYIAVFVITALCAAVIIGGVFGRCWYLRRRTKSQKFAVLHKPKRFFEPPRQLKHSNGHVSRRTSRDINMTDDLLAERPLNKTSELIFTRADIERNPRQKQQSQGLANTDEGDGSKGDNSTFYVNPMYDRNRQNSTASTTGSHPRVQGTPHRLSNASDGKTGILGSPARTIGKQQMRCNSMGNIPRSSQAGIQRRHPSAGNVASNKDMYQYPQQQNVLYNAPQIKGNYQGQGQGNYQGQQRTPMNQPLGVNSPARQGVGPHQNPLNQRPSGPQHGSPTKTPQRNRPIGPGSATYPSPGQPGRRGNRPNSPYEYGAVEKDQNYSGNTDGQRYTRGIDPNTAQRYHGNTPGEAPQRGVNKYGDVSITVNPANSQGPMQHRSNGPNPPSEGWSNANSRDPRLPCDPHPNDHSGDMSGYGKSRSKLPADTLSPLDGAQVDPRFVGGPNSESNNFRPNTYEGARPQMHYPAPPDQASDSSEDDLYSIVAKGNYDSVVNDPLNAHQTFKAEKKKHRNTPESNSAGRTSSRMFNGRDTSV